MRQPSLIYLMGFSLLSLFAGLLVTVGVPAIQSAEPSELAVVYNEVQAEGRRIYIREGCWYCHTQQVRSVEVEEGTVHVRGDLGPESEPGDYYYQKPVLWGTNRQGPDLSHVGSRPLDKRWHIRHLEEPRKVVPGSIMPSFTHLSDEDLDALAEYLLALK